MTMKVTNISDVETTKLHAQGLVNQSFQVGSEILAPGASYDVPPEAESYVMNTIGHLVQLGAICLGDVPESYTQAKARQGEPRQGSSNEAPQPPKRP